MFEGICLVMPTKDAMREQEKFSWVYAGCMCVIATVFGLSGVLGYAAFGDDTQGIVLLNFSKGNVLISMIQIAYAAAVVFTYPFQLLPAAGVMENYIFGPVRSNPPLARKTLKSLFRTFCGALLCVVALSAQSSFDNFISIVGAFCGVPLALIYPPLIYMLFLWTQVGGSEEKVGWLGKLAVSLMTVVGFLVFVLVTVVNLYEIFFSNSDST